MKVEHSFLRTGILKKIEKPYGNFYIFERYIIGEISEGVHFTWTLAEEIIEEVYEFFGSRDIKVSYVSNRIHSYSLHASDWLEFYRNRHTLQSFAIVTYTKIGFMNVVVEKLFSETKMKQFSNLEKAITWVDKQHIRNESNSIEHQ